MHHPGLWASRIHFVAFYGLIGLGLFSLRAALQQVSTQQVPDPDQVLVLLMLPVLLAAGFWGWRFSLFSTAKVYARQLRLHAVQNQLVVALGLLVLLCIPLTYTLLLTHKVASVESRNQLISDVNALNIGEYLTMGPDQYSWINLIDGAFSYQELEQIVENTRSEQGKLAHLQAYLSTLEKYGIRLDPQLRPEQLLYAYKKDGPPAVDYIEKDKVFRHISRIDRAQRNALGYQQADSLHLVIFFFFFLWLGILIFQQVQWKVFALSLLLGVAGLIAGSFLGLGMEAWFGLEGATPYSLIFVVALLFLLIQTYRSYNSKRLKAWKSVCMSLAAFLTPFLPLMMVLMVNNELSKSTQNGLWYLGLLLGIYMWNAAYHQRFAELQAQPKDN
ncbi:MAG: hypothetical protein D6730_04700 [Bacteroidetes bacterium]|nr:MAG: hypothetical protein D6730_04700 [Bacteroidota bacterium]